MAKKINVKNEISISAASPVIFVQRIFKPASFINVCVKDVTKISFAEDKSLNCTGSKVTIYSKSSNEPIVLRNIWCIRFVSIFYSKEYPFDGIRTLKFKTAPIISAIYREKQNTPPIKRNISSLSLVTLSKDSFGSNLCEIKYYTDKTFKLRYTLSLDIYTCQMFTNTYYDVTLYNCADIKFLGKRNINRSTKTTEFIKNVDFIYFGKSDPITSFINKTSFHIHGTSIDKCDIWYTSGNFTLL